MVEKVNINRTYMPGNFKGPGIHYYEEKNVPLNLNIYGIPGTVS